MVEDRFSTRLAEGPHEVEFENFVKPRFELDFKQYYFEPMHLLNEAYLIMLEEVGMLSTAEAADISEVLEDLQSAGWQSISAEDYHEPHVYVESHLIDELGPYVGGKLHTGRSRTDLHDAIVRVILREKILEIMNAVVALRDTIQDRASETMDVVFTAYTHSQPAEPITFAHYLLAFDHLLERDLNRLRSAYKRTNLNILGTAVTGGSRFPVDRKRLTELAGFSNMCYNTYDAVASVDFVPETANVAAQLMSNISRLARDFIEWSTFEFGFIELSDGFARESSMLPQKKNPKSLEYVRSSASDFIGMANSALVHQRGTPYADVGEVSKYSHFLFVQNTDRIIQINRLMAGIIETLELNEEEMYLNAAENFSTMSELADTLVLEEDLSYRQSHGVIAELVRQLVDSGQTADQATIDDLNDASRQILGKELNISPTELEAALEPSEFVERRDIIGGTAPEESQKELDHQRDSLDEYTHWVNNELEHLEEAKAERKAQIERIRS